jgi:N-acetylglucosaminyl-diphospho-decaprenol L-rhamnosyltransferase
LPNAAIPIVIIGFRNPSDVTGCLRALAQAPREPEFAVFICENGGRDAYDSLVAALSSDGGPCPGAPLELNAGEPFPRGCHLKLAQDIDVTIGEAPENLGYAGGINAWIGNLLQQPGWPGLWVLNPDTQPTPDALAELVDYAKKYDKGMVGSRIMFMGRPNVVGSRGLTWSRWLSRTTGVDIYAPATPAPDRLDVERRIDSPHGASFYITRPCLEKIGLMDERYFLYFEDLDWGLRAKAVSGVGYAYQSVVPHQGGTTIGSASGRASRSRLAVYLDFRNRLLFVRKNYPGWYPWTVAVVMARSLEFLAVGSVRNFRAAMAGWSAGLVGETGRPDRLLKQMAG